MINLGADWEYVLEVSKRRLANNKTKYHVSDYGTDIEVIGAAGELAARRCLGLPEKLHEHFDGGVDLIYRNWRINVRSTGATPGLRYKYLQWPQFKPVNCDIALMMAVDISQHVAYALGFALQEEILKAPINYKRRYPCREVAIANLHPLWMLETIWPKNQKTPTTATFV